MPQIFPITDPTWSHRAVSGDIIIRKGGGYFIYQGKGKENRKTYRGTRYNSLFKKFSDWFKFIGTESKASWNEYKQYIGSSRSARNPYLKNNIQIMAPDVPGTVEVKSITSPPQYPHIPLCFSAYFDISRDGIVYYWFNDYSTVTIVEAGYYNVPGRIAPPLNWMKIGGGNLSINEYYYLPGNLFCPGRYTYASIRSINLRGEVSPWAPPIRVDVPDKPIVDFSGAPRKGYSPLSVDFLNITEGDVKSYLWLFGDGSSSYLKNPTHIFTGLPYSAFSISLLTNLSAFSKPLSMLPKNPILSFANIS